MEIEEEGAETMDLIDRQAAIDAISEGVSDDAFLMVALIKSKINKIPSAQPERPTGHWIAFGIPPYDSEDVICSECGKRGCAYYWHYCPSCGARIEESRWLT